MKLAKKICIVAFFLIILVLVGFRVILYLNACIKTRDDVAFYAEMLMLTPEKANTIIPYETLSKKYKNTLSSEEYSSAVEPTELLKLYSNSVFQQHLKRKVDITLSTDGYKKVPAGVFQVGDEYYHISHVIDVAPNLITLEPEIVRWNIDIYKIDDPNSNIN